jgi:hypothetical protein
MAVHRPGLGIRGGQEGQFEVGVLQHRLSSLRQCPNAWIGTDTSGGPGCFSTPHPAGYACRHRTVAVQDPGLRRTSLQRSSVNKERGPRCLPQRGPLAMWITRILRDDSRPPRLRFTPPARPRPHGPPTPPQMTFKPTRYPSWPLRLPTCYESRPLGRVGPKFRTWGTPRRFVYLESHNGENNDKVQELLRCYASSRPGGGRQWPSNRWVSQREVLWHG